MLMINIITRNTDWCNSGIIAVKIRPHHSWWGLEWQNVARWQGSIRYIDFVVSRMSDARYRQPQLLLSYFV